MKIPYHKSLIGEGEIEEVITTIRSGWLTAGQRVENFEDQFAQYRGAQQAVAVSSCTAGLFLAMRSLDLQPGDEVVTTPYSFVASTNVILQNNGTPVFADINPHTYNIDPDQIAAKISPKTKAILVVHVGGNPCEMDRIMEIAAEHDLPVIEDCAHAIEGAFDDQPLGTFGYAASFSFYPTKNITAAEGGMLLTSTPALADRFRILRRHGLDANAWERQSPDDYRFYDVIEPGFKCNMTDIQAAIGMHQLEKIEDMYNRRQEIYSRYQQWFSGIPGVHTTRKHERGKASHHLYILRIEPEKVKYPRDEIIRQIQQKGVMLSVNYQPIHLFSWFRKNMGFKEGDFPNAEMCGANCFSLPFYPALKDEEVDYVIDVVRGVLTA